MSDCDKFIPHISEYLENRLSPEIKKQVDQHIQSCSSCAQRLQNLTKLQFALSNLTMHSCSPQFSFKLQQKIRSTGNKPLPVKRLTKRLTYGFSFAAFLLIVFLGYNNLNFVEEESSTVIEKNTGNEEIMIENPVTSTEKLTSHTKSETIVDQNKAEGVDIKTKTNSDSSKQEENIEKDPRIKYVDKK